MLNPVQEQPSQYPKYLKIIKGVRLVGMLLQTNIQLDLPYSRRKVPVYLEPGVGRTPSFMRKLLLLVTN